MTISGNEVSGYTLMDKSSTVYRRLLTKQFLLLRVGVVNEKDMMRSTVRFKNG